MNSFQALPSSAVGNCRYRIDPERGLRVEEYEGIVSLGDLRSAVADMAGDPGWSPDLHGLIDFSRATLDLTSNDVLRLGLMLRQSAYRSRGWLAVTVGDSGAFGIVRMLGYWARSTDRTRIFRDRGEAERWLQATRHDPPPREYFSGVAA